MAFAGPIDEARSKAGLTSTSGIVNALHEAIHLPATLKQQWHDSFASFERAMNGQGSR